MGIRFSALCDLDHRLTYADTLAVALLLEPLVLPEHSVLTIRRASQPLATMLQEDASTGEHHEFLLRSRH